MGVNQPELVHLLNNKCNDNNSNNGYTVLCNHGHPISCAMYVRVLF